MSFDYWVKRSVSIGIIVSIALGVTAVPAAGYVISETFTTQLDTSQEVHKITISSDGERVNYEFDVTGTIEKVDTDTEESVSEGHAEGVVVDGTDVFEFTGSLQRYTDDGDPTVKVNGNTIDTSEYGDRPDSYRTIEIKSDGERVNYDFDARSIQQVDTDSQESILDGRHAEGVVVDGSDVFRFKGSIKDYEDDGSPTVLIDGNRVDTTTLGDAPEKQTHRITIDSDGDRVNYRFDVSGSVTKVDTDTEESVSGGTASGTVVSGKDVFEYTGHLQSYEDNGDPKVIVDGRTINTENYDDSPDEERVIEIESDGTRVNYDLDVTGTIREVKTDAQESVSGGHAEGVVTDGSDVFRYTGSIAGYEDDGRPTVRIDGQTVNTADIGDRPESTPNRITIRSDGEVIDYEFSVTGSVSEVDTDAQESVAGGYAKGRVIDGSDTFEYTGDIIYYNDEGNAEVRVNGNIMQSMDDVERPDNIHTLVIKGDGDKNTRTNYRFTVSDALSPAETFDDNRDVVSGTTGQGVIADAEDRFVYRGEIESFDAWGTGDMTVVIDGVEQDVTVSDTAPDGSSSSSSSSSDGSSPQEDSNVDELTTTTTQATDPTTGSDRTETATNAGPSAPDTPVTTTGGQSSIETESDPINIEETPETDDSNSGLSSGVGDGFGTVIALVIVLMVTVILGVYRAY
jgi:hypothetical protein